MIWLRCNRITDIIGKRKVPCIGRKTYFLHSGNELGYLSFVDDRLYYVVIPLFEQKKVQIEAVLREYQAN
jgi:hypothetical protein